MKKNLLIASLALAALVPALATDIVASPKLSEVLNSQKSVAAKDTAVVTKADGVFASPKLREQLNSHRTVAAAPQMAKAACCTGSKLAIASPKALETLKPATSSCCGETSCVVACTK